MWRFAVGLSLALLAWNNLIHLVPGTSTAYVPLNLVVAGVVVSTARRHGLSSSDLGLRRDRVRAGARWGGAVAAVVAGGLALAVAVPGLRPLLDEQPCSASRARCCRLSRTRPGPVRHRGARRVGLRGALLAALGRCTDWTRAAAASSAVFGFWHVRPTLGLLDANDIADDPVARAGAVGAAIVATAVGGMFFCALRRRSDSTLAPIVAHTAMNSPAVLASAITR